MSVRRVAWATVLLAAATALAVADARAADAAPRGRTTAEVLAASGPGDWRPLDPARTLYLELDAGRVVIELAPEFAPRHAANIVAFARAKWFDGLAIARAQDNYVVQWGPTVDASDAPPTRPPPAVGATRVPPEFERAAAGLPFTKLPDGDVYAPEVGFVDGFPVGRTGPDGEAWLAHCYGMVGVGRDEAPDSGIGTELYAVIGHSPRHLDRNVALVGRVVAGMPLLAALPRGTGPMGFYERPAERVPIRAVRLAADVPPAERTPLEILRTDTATFDALVESRRNRRDPWTYRPAGRIELCNVPLPARPAAATPAGATLRP